MDWGLQTEYRTKLYRENGGSEFLRNFAEYLSSLLEFVMTQITLAQRSLLLCNLTNGTKTKFDVTYKKFDDAYC
jgi:hypothetical protein